MTTATRPLHKRIALVSDFDATLAPGSVDALLRRMRLKPESFWRERIDPLVDQGWEAILANFYALIQESRSRRDGKITRELLREVGRGLEPYPGVPEMFDRVRGWARDALPGVEVEFYVVTSGHERSTGRPASRASSARSGARSFTSTRAARSLS